VSKHDRDSHRGSKQEHDGGFRDLSEAAEGLAHELRRFEELATAARRLPLNTHRAIERAAKATTGAAAEQGQVDLALGALVRAITAVRERHEVNVAALVTRGEEVRRRAEEFSALHDRFAAFGEEGRQINELVQDAAAKQRDARTPEAVRAVAAAIGDVEARMSRLSDDARAFGQQAAAASITDLAEQADALRQQTSAARNKLALLRKSLLASLPDPSQLN